MQGVATSQWAGIPNPFQHTQEREKEQTCLFVAQKSSRGSRSLKMKRAGAAGEDQMQVHHGSSLSTSKVFLFPVVSRSHTLGVNNPDEAQVQC